MLEHVDRQTDRTLDAPQRTATDRGRRSAASRRTRQAIVEAAIETFGQDQTASLADIARAAEVSRSTLHRQFEDRSALLAAVDAECRRRFDQASLRSNIADGSGLDALGRLAQEYLDLGSVLSLIFADNALIDPDSWENDPADAPNHQSDLHGEHGLAAIIERGHRDGSIDRGLPTAWVITTLWVLLFGAWQLRSGGSSRHEIGSLLARTLTGALAPRDEP